MTATSSEDQVFVISGGRIVSARVVGKWEHGVVVDTGGSLHFRHHESTFRTSAGAQFRLLMEADEKDW